MKTIGPENLIYVSHNESLWLVHLTRGNWSRLDPSNGTKTVVGKAEAKIQEISIDGIITSEDIDWTRLRIGSTVQKAKLLWPDLFV